VSKIQNLIDAEDESYAEAAVTSWALVFIKAISVLFCWIFAQSAVDLAVHREVSKKILGAQIILCWHAWDILHSFLIFAYVFELGLLM
jgi:hypothetical protein